MFHHKHTGQACPKCGARVIIIMDDLKGKEIERCSRFPHCDYHQEKGLKKPPKKD